MPTPQITVLLPLFESAPIAWLAIESLCQQKVKQPWELIVAEEQRPNKCGEDYFEEFLPRLEAAGMVRFRYLPLHKRLHLSEKWRMMSWFIHPKSQVSLLQAADCYSEPKRLQTALKAIAQGFDWVNSPKGLFYHIGLDQAVLYDAQTVKRMNKFKTHLNMAMRSELLRFINYKQLSKGVDRYLFNEVNRVKKERGKAPFRVFEDKTENWKKGVDTHGFNHISHKRGTKFEAVKWPFVETTLTIDNVVPAAVAAKLKELHVSLNSSKKVA